MDTASQDRAIASDAVKRFLSHFLWTTKHLLPVKWSWRGKGACSSNRESSLGWENCSSTDTIHWEMSVQYKNRYACSIAQVKEQVFNEWQPSYICQHRFCSHVSLSLYNQTFYKQPTNYFQACCIIMLLFSHIFTCLNLWIFGFGDIGILPPRTALHYRRYSHYKPASGRSQITQPDPESGKTIRSFHVHH